MPENQEVHGGSNKMMVDKVLGFKRELGFGIVIIIAGLLLYMLLSYLQERAELKAWSKIFVAQFDAQTGTKPESELLEKVITECRGAHALFYAQMLRYGELGVENNPVALEAAQKTCEQFLAEFPSHPMAGQVRVDYGTILANSGKYDLARTQYELIAKSGPEYLRRDASLFQALCYEKEGKAQEALDIYTRITTDLEALNYGDVAVDYAAFAKALLQQKQTAAIKAATAAAEATPTKVATPAATREASAASSAENAAK